MKVGDHVKTEHGKCVHEFRGPMEMHCGMWMCQRDRIVRDPVTCKKCLKAKEQEAMLGIAPPISDRWSKKPLNTLPQIVCLCGSTRFWDTFHESAWQLTLDGYIVLSIGVCKHAEDHGGEAIGPEIAAKLDELHLRKIDLSDWVLILNVEGYIGESTQKEIEYAQQHGKKIVYLENKEAKSCSE